MTLSHHILNYKFEYIFIFIREGSHHVDVVAGARRESTSCGGHYMLLQIHEDFQSFKKIYDIFNREKVFIFLCWGKIIIIRN